MAYDRRWGAVSVQTAQSALACAGAPFAIRRLDTAVRTRSVDDVLPEIGRNVGVVHNQGATSSGHSPASGPAVPVGADLWCLVRPTVPSIGPGVTRICPNSASIRESGPRICTLGPRICAGSPIIRPAGRMVAKSGRIIFTTEPVICPSGPSVGPSFAKARDVGRMCGEPGPMMRDGGPMRDDCSPRTREASMSSGEGSRMHGETGPMFARCLAVADVEGPMDGEHCNGAGPRRPFDWAGPPGLGKRRADGSPGLSPRALQILPFQGGPPVRHFAPHITLRLESGQGLPVSFRLIQEPGCSRRGGRRF